jgi:hypothetical protein
MWHVVRLYSIWTNDSRLLQFVDEWDVVLPRSTMQMATREGAGIVAAICVLTHE